MSTTCQIKRIKGDGELVIAAPHGEHDHYTGQMVEEICRKLGCAGVVVEDVVDPNTGKRVNVNRPTEGAGLEPDEEMPTEFASRVYHRYLSSVLRAATYRSNSIPSFRRSNFRFYVEIHGNEHKELEKVIEVATYNVPQSVARRVSAKYKSVLKNSGSLPAASGMIPLTEMGIALKIEGVNKIEKRAWANKLFGVLPLAQASLHFELPMAVRAGELVREKYVDILADVISFWFESMNP